MKRLLLKGLEQLEAEESEIPLPPTGFSLLRVLCCAICKTDAKMWSQGHRDLVFPRVPGHEMVVVDFRGHTDDLYHIDGKYHTAAGVDNHDGASRYNLDSGQQRYVVWPGQSCGNCRYCLEGRENLCEEMKITGFHHDGGFAQFIVVPTSSLVPLPPSDLISDTVGCFAEPVGCILNALDKLRLKKGERVIIYGGGTVGLIAALACLNVGALPSVVEKKEEKIEKIAPFLEATGILCFKDTVESEFDAVINCCADHTAFDLGIVKVARGGKFSFFSGITKNEHVETNLINLLHYKEVELAGAYGLTRKNMLDAVSFLEANSRFLELLVEDVVAPEKGVELMPQVLSGSHLKYILDFREGKILHDSKEKRVDGRAPESQKDLTDSTTNIDQVVDSDERWCRSLISTVTPVNQTIRPAAQGKIDNKTKPLGALGTLEDLAIQMSMIQQTLFPRVERSALFVFAGDHGVTEEGVSAYPSEVTRQMVKNFLDGGAAINVLCRHHDITMKIVDMGVNGEFEDHPDLIKRKVRKGTRNFAIEPAMTHEEVFLAVRHGMEIFLETHCGASSPDIVGLGEMGIGNTTSASAIISAITGITPEQATGRGTGIDDKGVEHKAEVIQKALNFHRPDSSDGFDILRKVGGYEIAGITGAVLAAASKGCAVVLDGVISTAAALVALLINPEIRGYLISGHRSVETAHSVALDHMGLKPVIDFGMRLGEGTGAALTINTTQAACKLMCEMASFDDAAISRQR